MRGGEKMTHTQKSPALSAATGQVDQYDIEIISFPGQQGKALLDLFPTQRRSAIANRFCYAVHILEREQLPLERRKQIKEQSAAQYREQYLKSQPATDKQISYLRALGCKEEVRSKWEAMQLIDKLMKK